MKAALVALRFPATPEADAEVGVPTFAAADDDLGTKAVAEAASAASGVREGLPVLALALALEGTKALLMGVKGVLGREETGV